MRNKRLKAKIITALKTITLIIIIIAIPSYYKWEEHKRFQNYMDCMNINLYSNIQDIANQYCLQKLK